jgi:hypothetical protein
LAPGRSSILTARPSPAGHPCGSGIDYHFVIPSRRPFAPTPWARERLSDPQFDHQGEIVARAKRTERAEARRRYRAYLAELEQEEAEGSEIDEADEDGRAYARAAARAAAEDKASTPRPGQRMGFFPAMKAAIRPIHYREDLRYAPQLITRTPAVWAPGAVAVGAAAIVIWRVSGLSIEEARQDTLVQLAVMFVLSPYVMLPGLVAGFLAPRASWMAGVFAALITTSCFGAVIASRPELIYESGTSLGTTDVAWTTVTLMTLSLPMGALLASFSAWYKRFLDLTGPGSFARQRAASQKQARKKIARQSPRRSR